MRVLIGITSYGTYHAGYLDRVLAEYASWPVDHRVLVFSESWKNLGQRAICVVKDQLQSSLDLTWAHRERFAQQQDDYDYFLYAEDDILVSHKNIVAWLVANEILGDGACVPALFVKETALDGRVNYPQAHLPFGWTGEIAEIAGHRFRRFSNVHPACCLLSQKQLKIAIASGRYVAEAHGNGPYAVREMACSGAFVECGLASTVDLTMFDDLTVEHLPANYFGVLGTSRERMKQEVTAMGGCCA